MTRIIGMFRTLCTLVYRTLLRGILLRPPLCAYAFDHGGMAATRVSCALIWSMKDAPMKLSSRHYFHLLAALAVLVLSVSASSQGNSAATPPLSPEDFRKYSGLFAAFGRVIQKAQGQVEVPAPRSQSRLLPLLPESTILYAAFSNYGEASHQLMKMFQDELRDDADLRQWWTSGDMATQGPKIEETLEKYYQLCQYLGDEVVVSAADRGKQNPAVLILAEVRKPGLKDFLQQSVKLAGNISIPRVLDASELAVAKDSPGPAVLVLPDLLVAAGDLTTLRHFNEQLEHKNQVFLSTAFGQRLAQSYHEGLTGVAGADMQRVLRNLVDASPVSDGSGPRSRRLTVI